ncbi:DUF6325 family protein [Rathayibacter sp. YIM 133350]|uniref:DUF6325 family protein n=1 Tax=Rathayibacter sp. YIM 133350 TaxID=3131992 RepID=UPI00307F0A9A
MPIGPVEVMVLTFPSSEGLRSIAGELERLVEGGKISVIDAIVVSRASDGTVEAHDLEEDEVPGFERIAPDPRDLLSDSDAEIVGEALEPGTVALVLAIEHRWAFGFYEKLREAGGEVALHVQIDHEDAVAALVD